MTAEISSLVCLLVGLLLYVLSFTVPKLGWLSPLGLIMFGVGLFHWLPGGHSVSIR